MTHLPDLWIFFVLHRFNAADTKGRSAVTGIFSILGIAFGVTALIVILSVMNGFQQNFIDTILQVSSAHIRLKGTSAQLEHARTLGEYKAFYLFSDAQTLLQGNYGRQRPALLRAIPKTIMNQDTDFCRTAEIKYGSFDIGLPYSIVLGFELAESLAVGIGDTVSIAAISGGASVDIFPENTECTVTGIIKTGYYSIDSSFSFISNDTQKLLAGENSKKTALVKLHNPESDRPYIALLKTTIPALDIESWRSYNHAFFGALRVEKNTMFMLVFLIFIVVTVNIYNGMRRAIYERREEISVLTSLGAKKEHVQFLFIANGLTIGFIGAFFGLLLGLLLSININDVFTLAEYIVNIVIEFLNRLLVHAGTADFAIFNPQYFYIDIVPVRIFFSEVLTVFAFGLFSAAGAAWFAAKKILMLKPAEVLRYE